MPADFRSIWVHRDAHRLDDLWRVWNLRLGDPGGDTWVHTFPRLTGLEPTAFFGPRDLRFRYLTPSPASCPHSPAGPFQPTPIRRLHEEYETLSARERSDLEREVASARLPFALTLWRLRADEDPHLAAEIRAHEQQQVPWLATGEVASSATEVPERRVEAIGRLPQKVLATALWGMEHHLEPRRVRLLAPAASGAALSEPRVKQVLRSFRTEDISVQEYTEPEGRRRTVTFNRGKRRVTVEVVLVRHVAEAIRIVFGTESPRTPAPPPLPAEPTGGSRRWMLLPIALLVAGGLAGWSRWGPERNAPSQPGSAPMASPTEPPEAPASAPPGTGSEEEPRISPAPEGSHPQDQGDPGTAATTIGDDEAPSGAEETDGTTGTTSGGTEPPPPTPPAASSTPSPAEPTGTSEPEEPTSSPVRECDLETTDGAAEQHGRICSALKAQFAGKPGCSYRISGKFDWIEEDGRPVFEELRIDVGSGAEAKTCGLPGYLNRFLFSDGGMSEWEDKLGDISKWCAKICPEDQ